MFEIGFWEILLIAVLALLVVGPERLPKAARSAGYWFGRARRYIEGVREEVASEFDVSELKRMVHNQEVMINDLKSQLNDTISLEDRDRQQEAVPDYEIIEEEAPYKKVTMPDGDETADTADAGSDTVRRDDKGV